MAAADVVLVVDDDEDIREAIRRIVTQCGYSVLAASDARAALRAAQAVDGPISCCSPMCGCPETPALPRWQNN
ncbi:hypothetical protein AB0F43_24895 [Kribbella sp. NPDC023972]|uniref:hypothetical protein n=1 Tax=Kribbella sp. NPDC023972 TaxID=3154795 RepID=UPI0033F69B46